MTRPDGDSRRTALLHFLDEATEPIPGARLAQRTGVSRQAIARDISVLRAGGRPIIATTRGYVLEKDAPHTRLVKVRHTRKQVGRELRTVIDLGAWIIDVLVNHRIYGHIRARLDIRSRLDVDHFIDEMDAGRSAPLMEITSGYHFHTIGARDEATLDAVEQALDEVGFIVPFLPYERTDALSANWSELDSGESSEDGATPH